MEQPVPNTHAQNAAKRWLCGANPAIMPYSAPSPASFSDPPSASVARGPKASKKSPPNTEKNAPKCAALPTKLSCSCVKSNVRFRVGEYTGKRYSVPLDIITASHSTRVSHLEA